MIGEIMSDSNLQGLWHMNQSHPTDVLLGHGEGTDTSTLFPDSTGKHTMAAVSDSQVDTAQAKFGSASYLFQGIGSTTVGEDLIQTDSHADFAFGASNFTVECWVRYNSTTGLRGIFRGSDGGYGVLHRFDTDSKLHLYLSSDTSFTNIANAVAGTKSSWSTGQWYHIALTWDGSDYRMFVDGVLDLTVTSSTATYSTAQRFTFGSWDSGNYGLNGWIDEVRINKGYCAYTGAFTPPTTAYVSSTDDSSGNNYNLTSSAATFIPEKFNNAGSFNGTNQYLSIADASCPNLEISGPQTWMCWFKPTQLGISHVVMSKRKNTTSSKYRIISLNNDNTFNFNISDLTGNTEAKSTVSPVINQWHHIAGVYDGSKLKIFINGFKNEFTASGTGGDTNSNFLIGADLTGTSDTPNNYTKGLIDECAIYNRALSDKEILDYYAWSLGRFTKVL